MVGKMQDTCKESTVSPVSAPVENWKEASRNLQTMDRERKEEKDEVENLVEEINKLEELAKISAEVKNAEEAKKFVKAFKELRPQTLKNFEDSHRFLALWNQLHGKGAMVYDIYEAAKEFAADAENAISRLVSEKVVREQWKIWEKDPVMKEKLDTMRKMVKIPPERVVTVDATPASAMTESVTLPSALKNPGVKVAHNFIPSIDGGGKDGDEGRRTLCFNGEGQGNDGEGGLLSVRFRIAEDLTAGEI